MLVASNSSLPANNFDAPVPDVATGRDRRLEQILALGLTARAQAHCVPGKQAFSSLPASVAQQVAAVGTVFTSGAVNDAAQLGPAVEQAGQQGAELDFGPGPLVLPMASTPSVAAQSEQQQRAYTKAPSMTPFVPKAYNPPGYAGLDIPRGTAASDYPTSWTETDYDPGEMSPGTPLSAVGGIRKGARPADLARPTAKPACKPACADNPQRPGVPWGELPPAGKAGSATAGLSGWSTALLVAGVLGIGYMVRK